MNEPLITLLADGDGQPRRRFAQVPSPDRGDARLGGGRKSIRLALRRAAGLGVSVSPDAPVPC